MKDSINHALLITGLLERDIARISASGNEAQQGLAADCAEHRRQLANKLRHIEHLSQMENEASAKAGDFTPLDWSAEEMTGWAEINEVSDDGYKADLVRKKNVEAWRSYDRSASWLGWSLAALAIGVIFAIVEIVATICQ